jgi:hypothetical protein
VDASPVVGIPADLAEGADLVKRSVMAMLRHEDFGDNIEAHLSYAHRRPPAEAAEILRMRLEDGTWRRNPAAWMMRFVAMSDQGRLTQESVATLREVFVAALLTDPIGRAAHETLSWLMGCQHGPTPTQTLRIITWLVASSGPSEVALIADVFDACSKRLPGLAHRLTPWLLEHGAAELRARRRLGLVIAMVDCILRHGDDHESLSHAVRYALRNEQPLASLPGAAAQLNVLLDATETLLSRGACRTLATAVVQATGRIAELLDPESAQKQWPRVSQAALIGLARDELTDDVAREGWRAALWGRNPSLLRDVKLASAHALELGLEALAKHANFKERRHEGGDPNGSVSEHAGAWAQRLTEELVRIDELALSPQVCGHLDRLRQCIDRANGGSIDKGVCAGLRAALAPDSSAEHLRLCCRLLTELGDDAHEAVTAILHALGGEPTLVGPEPYDAALLDELLRRLDRIVAERWSDVVPGFDPDAVLGVAKKVQLKVLPDEDKVRVAGDVAHLDEKAMLDIVRLRWPREERVAFGVLYFLHELAHLAQGIGRKEVVTRLRATGGETTLMHLDLAADHAAALLANAAVPKWPLEWLKDLEGLSCSTFPVTPYHTAASRARKAHRLVGLRADLLARRARLLDGSAGYAFVEYGPAGGSILLMESGPIMRVLRVSVLSPEQARVLDEAADPPADSGGVEGLDRLLAGIFSLGGSHD